MYNNYGGNNQGWKNNQNNNGFKESKFPKTVEVINKIKSAANLKSVLTPEYISLPNNAAYNIGSEMKDSSLKTNQLRKIFDMVKMVEVETDLVAAKNTLYNILPMVAYSVGRSNCPKEFFELLQACIDPKKLQTMDDVKQLVSFMEAIVAYSKYFS